MLITFYFHWMQWIRKNQKHAKVWNPTTNSYQDRSRKQKQHVCTWCISFFIWYSTVHCELILNLKRYILYASIRHSQKMSEIPLPPLIIADRSGNIFPAHWTCMTGLGKLILYSVHIHIVSYFFSWQLENLEITK